MNLRNVLLILPISLPSPQFFSITAYPERLREWPFEALATVQRKQEMVPIPLFAVVFVMVRRAHHYKNMKMS